MNTKIRILPCTEAHIRRHEVWCCMLGGGIFSLTDRGTPLTFPLLQSPACLQEVRGFSKSDHRSLLSTHILIFTFTPTHMHTHCFFVSFFAFALAVLTRYVLFGVYRAMRRRGCDDCVNRRCALRLPSRSVVCSCICAAVYVHHCC
jgi:hypothetical protein